MKTFAVLMLAFFIAGCTQSIDYSYSESNDYESGNGQEYDYSGHDEYDYGNYDAPIYGKAKEDIGCWADAGFINIPCPDDWELVHENKWKQGNLYFEIIIGSDEPGVVSSGETLVNNRRDLYSNFSGFNSQGVYRAFGMSFSKIDAYSHLFNYEGEQNTGVETIFVRYRNYYDTEWVIARSYGPHLELSDDSMHIKYIEDYSEELI